MCWICDSVIFFSRSAGTFSGYLIENIIRSMLIILDGNSEKKCARKDQSVSVDLFKAYLSRSSSVTNRIFFFSRRKEIFSFMRAQYVMSHYLI